MQVPAPSSDLGLELNLEHKNRLQELAQNASIPFPLYETVNEGSQHAPMFRSTVKIDGKMFTSHNTFLHRKEAEQDVAKLALEGLSSDKTWREGFPLLLEDTTFCKSIVHEYTVKMNLDRPTYTTISIPGGKLPVFTSSFVCDGTTYAGVPGRNKKEAEQNAARTFIDTILAHSDTNMLMSPIMQSKDKLLYKGSSSGTLVMPSEAKKPIEEYSCGPNSIVVNDTSLPNVSDPADCNQANDGNPLVGSSMQHFGSPDGVLDNERKRMSNDQGNRHSKKTSSRGNAPTDSTCELLRGKVSGD